jgi:regulator of sirC expression with transglutaminase-like and TPR domain
MNTTPSLRPLTIGSFLDRTLQLYRAHFFALVRPVALIHVALLIFRLLARSPYGAAYDLETYRVGLARAAPLFISTVNDWILAGLAPRWDFFFLEMSLLVMFSIYLTQTLTLAFARSAYGPMGMPGLQPIAGPSFYGRMAIVLLVLVGANGLCEWASQAINAPFLLQILVLAPQLLPALVDWQQIGLSISIVLLGLTLSMAFCIGPQLVILEGCGAIAGLRRSWRLVRPSFWRVLGLVLIVGLLTLLFTGLPWALATLAPRLIDRTTTWPWLMIAAVGLSQIGMVAILPFQIGALTLLYYDLRVRHEGYDIEVQRQHMAGTHYATLLEAGDTKLAAGDPAGALTDYDQALAAYPDDIAVLSRRGAARQRLGDLAGALADGRRVLEHYPNEPQTLVNCGVVLQQMGDHAEALAQYQRALKTNPRFEPALYNLACLYAVQNEAATALRYLKQAIQRDAAWREHACTDPDFEPLRADPRFVALTNREKRANR